MDLRFFLPAASIGLTLLPFVVILIQLTSFFLLLISCPRLGQYSLSSDAIDPVFTLDIRSVRALFTRSS